MTNADIKNIESALAEVVGKAMAALRASKTSIDTSDIVGSAYQQTLYVRSELITICPSSTSSAASSPAPCVKGEELPSGKG